MVDHRGQRVQQFTSDDNLSEKPLHHFERRNPSGGWGFSRIPAMVREATEEHRFPSGGEEEGRDSALLYQRTKESLGTRPSEQRSTDEDDGVGKVARPARTLDGVEEGTELDHSLSEEATFAHTLRGSFHPAARSGFQANLRCLEHQRSKGLTIRPRDKGRSVYVRQAGGRECTRVR